MLQLNSVHVQARISEYEVHVHAHIIEGGEAILEY